MAAHQGVDAALLARAQAGADTAFEELVGPYRARLTAHCYRMLGSVHDAEDALQETLVNAWRGLSGFQARSSLATWLYRIATRVCLRMAARRGPRLAAHELNPARTDVGDLGEHIADDSYLQPFPFDPVDPDTDPEAAAVERESIELAYVAALQHLSANQRAALLLRDVLSFPAADVAQLLDTSVAAVNSALQRARDTMSKQTDPAGTQARRWEALGDERQRDLVRRLIAAWEAADVTALVALLAADVRLSMPPFPAWYDGRDDVARFFAHRVFASPWRVVETRANQQLAFAGYMADPEQQGAPAPFSEITVVELDERGMIVGMTAFLDPVTHAGFVLPASLPLRT
jgi:RNA polymerase sigma-70 factor (ECF subfamily)